MSSNSENFLQLKDENFEQWSTQVKFYMLGQGLMTHLTAGIDKIKIYIQRNGASSQQEASVDKVEDEVMDSAEEDESEEARESYWRELSR